MKLTRFTGEEWSALYVDGKLERVGDSYLIDERISQLVGVEENEDESYSFLMGGNDYSDAAKTLDELYEWKRNQKELADESSAAALRAQAEELLRQADELDK